MLICKKW